MAIGRFAASGNLVDMPADRTAHTVSEGSQDGAIVFAVCRDTAWLNPGFKGEWSVGIEFQRIGHFDPGAARNGDRLVGFLRNPCGRPERKGASARGVLKSPIKTSDCIHSDLSV
ncbi:hypothetical protein SDC9_182454 [bioreactor metagenome]|uniref:Uncharacterized protein n=1 Tax=bioreactor metagenome TaxID=1076179 RepID=A0A645H8D9_9ZZZZ